MKRKSVCHGEQLRPAKLYLDDVEEIARVLTEASEELRIEADDFILDNLGQLAELKKPFLTNLTLAIGDPYVSLGMGPSGIWLYIASDDPVSRGLFEKIRAILQRRTRRLSMIYHNSLLAGSAIGLSIVGIQTTAPRPTWVAFFALCLVVSIAWAVGGHNDRFKSFSIVVPVYRRDSPSFFQRNHDRLVLALLSAIAGGILTFLGSKLAGSLR